MQTVDKYQYLDRNYNEDVKATKVRTLLVVRPNKIYIAKLNLRMKKLCTYKRVKSHPQQINNNNNKIIFNNVNECMI